MSTWSLSRLIGLACVLLLVFIVGWKGALYAHDRAEQDCIDTYTLVNAEIVCEDHDHVISKANYTKLRNAIEGYIAEQQERGAVSHVSVHFRDLVNGPVMGIAETEDFAPASLLKVPLAFVYLNREQDQPGFLDTLPPMMTAALTSDDRIGESKNSYPTLRNLNQVYKPLEPMERNTAYGVKELLFRMLAYSDNMALDLLASYVQDRMGGNAEIHSVFEELGLTEGANLIEETVSVRGYASIFRSLYHATYLNADLSQQVMQWLSESSFEAGLRAGVPKDVVVAHKFGERDWRATNTHQLHDCGVVYYPGNPYLLCVMTKGKSTLELAPVIAEISRMVYEEVDSRKLR